MRRSSVLKRIFIYFSKINFKCSLHFSFLIVCVSFFIHLLCVVIFILGPFYFDSLLFVLFKYNVSQLTCMYSYVCFAYKIALFRRFNFIFSTVPIKREREKKKKRIEEGKTKSKNKIKCNKKQKKKEKKKSIGMQMA